MYSSCEGEGKGYKDIVVFCISMISPKSFCFWHAKIEMLDLLETNKCTLLARVL